MTQSHLRASARAVTFAAAAAVLTACGAVDAPAAQRSAPDTAAPTPDAAPAVHADDSRANAAPARVVVHGVDLTGVGYDVGDPRAPIVMVEFSDFGCPFCAQHARETFPALQRDFIATGKVFYKHVPFVMGMFPNGDRAARAAECAGEQERFWPMHDSVYAHQNDWKRGSDPDAVLAQLARQVVPDAERWGACYAADRQKARTVAANTSSQRLGVRATPTFFVNGQMVEGALPLPVFQQALGTMLRELGDE